MSLVIALAYFKKWIVYPCVHIDYSTFLMDYTISMCSDWLSLDWELQVIFFPLYFTVSLNVSTEDMDMYY